MPDSPFVSLRERGPWVLALDAGTSSVRARLYDREARPLDGPAARGEYAWRTDSSGAMEADADELVACACAVVDGALADARRLGLHVAAVAVTGFWHGLVGWDAAGRALTPLFGWGDTRGRDAAARLASRVDARAAHGRTGCFVHEMYPAVRLVWLRQAAGASFRRVAGWGSWAELLALRLFGEARCSVSMASGTGLLDVRRLRWDAELLAAVGVPASALPPVGDEPQRGLLPAFAARWPELARVPWYPALGDGACASLGTGAVGARLALTVGTSAAVRALRGDPEPVVPDDLWCYRLDARRTVTGRALSNAGSAFAWLRRTLALPPPDELERQLAALEPGAHGLTVWPALLGERPPVSRPGEHASLAGLTQSTTPVQIVQAWMEAVAANIAGAVGAVERAFGPAEAVVAGGGALHASPVFAGMVAAALGRPLTLTPDPEATARGAALLALERLGVIADATAVPAESGVVVDAAGPGATAGAPLSPRPPLPRQRGKGGEHQT